MSTKKNKCRALDQRGIKGEGAVLTQNPTQVFLTNLPLKSQEIELPYPTVSIPIHSQVCADIVSARTSMRNLSFEVLKEVSGILKSSIDLFYHRDYFLLQRKDAYMKFNHDLVQDLMARSQQRLGASRCCNA